MAVSSEATDPADRLADIKTQCEFGPLIGRTDALYLIAEVERLRAAESILQKLSVNRALFARFADLESLTDEERTYLAALTDGTEAPK